MCLLNCAPLSQLRQTVREWGRGRKDEQPGAVPGQGQPQPWALCPSSVTSMIRLSTGIVVLTMCTFGVDVERCLWDREPSEEGLEGLKVKAWGVEYLCWELRRKQRQKESCGYFFFPSSKWKTLFNLTCPKAIYTQFQAEKKLGFTHQPNCLVSWTIPSLI